MILSNALGNWKLVNKAGVEANKGDVVTCFRGEDHWLLGGSPPHKQGSSGHVSVKKVQQANKMEKILGDSQYYPTVFDLKWEYYPEVFDLKQVQLVKEQA